MAQPADKQYSKQIRIFIFPFQLTFKRLIILDNYCADVITMLWFSFYSPVSYFSWLFMSQLVEQNQIIKQQAMLPMWASISTIFSMLLGSIRGEVILFSTARHTPSDVWMPMAVEPNCKRQRDHHTEHHTFMQENKNDDHLVQVLQVQVLHFSHINYILLALHITCLNKSIPWWLRWHTPLEKVFLLERKCSRLYREKHLIKERGTGWHPELTSALLPTDSWDLYF